MINKKPDNILLSGFFCRAGDEVRTRDIQLGRLTLYQLSYSRNYNDINNFSSANIRAFAIIFQIFLNFFIVFSVNKKVKTYKSMIIFLITFLLIKIKTNE